MALTTTLSMLEISKQVSMSPSRIGSSQFGRSNFMSDCNDMRIANGCQKVIQFILGKHFLHLYIYRSRHGQENNSMRRQYDFTD
jgi:hypothetical protein